MKGHKTLTLANFNCLFSINDEDYPMLDFFNIIRKASLSDKKYRGMFLYDTKIIETKTMGYCLYGKIVKDTQLEINSRYNKETYILEELSKTEVHQSSPYSEFILILKNHRLLFTPSQKGSPTVSNLRSVFKSNITDILRDCNRKKEEKDKLLLKFFDIIELPRKTNILNELNEFEKISSFSLTFFQLNNDILNNFFDSAQKVKAEMKSSEMTQQFKNPQDRKLIAKMIQKTDGMVDIELKANKKGEAEKTYKNNDFKERVEMDLPDFLSLEENIQLLIDQKLDDNRIKRVSRDNQSAYERFIEKMKKIGEKLF